MRQTAGCLINVSEKNHEISTGAAFSSLPLGFRGFSLGGWMESYVESADIYAENLKESIEIDGILYTYTYSYDDNESRTITITNDQDEMVDTIKYEESSSIIYLNGSSIGKVDFSNESVIPMASDNWIYIGSGSTNISWAMGTTTAVVAGAIAVALPGAGTLGIIAAMGTGTLGILAASAIGGTVSMSSYRANTTAVISYKYIWSFKASTGDKYGPYTTGYTL